MNNNNVVTKEVMQANQTTASQETLKALKEAKSGVVTGDTHIAKGHSEYVKSAVNCITGWICTDIDLAFIISDMISDNTLSSSGRKMWAKTVTILMGGIDIQDNKTVYAPHLADITPPDKTPKKPGANLFWQVKKGAKKSEANKQLTWLQSKFTVGKKIAYADMAIFIKSLQPAKEEEPIDIPQAIKMLEKYTSGKRKPTDSLRTLIQNLRKQYELV